MTGDSGFIRRWSRRKQAAKTAAPRDADPVAESAGDGRPATGDTDPPAADSGAPPEAGTGDPPPEGLDLPDIDSLTAESDFHPFMKEGVPKELRNRALRKLWRVDPVFSKLDGLNDYDGDFTDSASVVAGLKTLYKVGRGFLPEAEPAGEDAAEPPETAEEDGATGGDATAEADGPVADEPPESDVGGNKNS